MIIKNRKANVYDIEIFPNCFHCTVYDTENERARRAITRPPNPLDGSRLPRTRATFSQSPKGHLDHESHGGKALGCVRGCEHFTLEKW